MTKTPTLQICEIFKSIQGESSYSGQPCIFIRLVGCNLRCSYCDTTYSYDGGETKTIEEIINKVIALNCPLVEITGGEPLLQSNVHILIQELNKLNKKVIMETNGSVELPPKPRDFTAIMDIKTPSSNESEKMFWENLNNLQQGDEIKFVVGSKEDIDWSFNIVKDYGLGKDTIALFSPIFGRIDLAYLAERVTDSQLPIRMQLQMHKFIWNVDERGV